MITVTPADYTYDAPDLPPSPVTLDDLAALAASAGFTDADREALRLAGQVLADQVEEVLNVCNRPYDERWLAYQHEIALRHTAAKQNRTDSVNSVPHVPLRHVIAPITATVRPFLAGKGHSSARVDRMHAAWTTSVTVQIALWSQPYTGAQW
jgi:hypothetical protein